MAAPADVHFLGPRDIDLMRALNAVFSAAFEDPETYRLDPPDDAYLASQLAKPHVIVAVACVAGEVIGGLTAYQLDKLEQERREIYIYDLAVAEQHRRRGIATALIAAVQREAARRKAYVVFVQADPQDPPAIALYAKLGSGAIAHHFDIPPQTE